MRDTVIIMKEWRCRVYPCHQHREKGLYHYAEIFVTAKNQTEARKIASDYFGEDYSEFTLDVNPYRTVVINNRKLERMT